MTPPSHQPVALITGASSGIGAAIARQLACRGWAVILVARRLERLQALATELAAEGCSAFPLAADLSSEMERKQLYEAVHTRFGVPDVLINNAGFGWYGFGEQMTWETARQMMQVNIEAAVHLTLLFLPAFKSRRRGHIINIGSIAGSFPNQGVALYSATKSFIDAFTTGLYRELSGTGVQISVVRAGAVATPFFDVASEKGLRPRIPIEWAAITPERVARRVWSLVKRPRRVIYVPGMLFIVPWVELIFGWLVDHLGPLLLRWQKSG